MASFTVVINAGGKSSRMGVDKSFVEIGGQTMIEQIVDQTRGLGDDTVIVANDPARYAFLGLPTFTDLLPDTGALGGLYTAIHVASQPYALVLACDMPFLNRPLLEYMMSLAPDFDAVVPRITPSPTPSSAPPPSAVRAAPRGGAPLPMGDPLTRAGGKGLGAKAEAEPFRAVYSKACLDPIRRALDAGKMRVISFFPDIRLRWVEEDEVRQFDRDLLTFTNCNTAEELDAMRRLWRELHP